MPTKKPDPQREQRLLEVCQRIDYRFRNIGLLNLALSHSSLGNEGLPNYERLEFLGDAVLGFLVADSLYQRQPEIVVGELTSRRSLMVSRPPLAMVAADLGLGPYIQVGRGLSEDALRSPRIMADLVEAVLGAVYVDGGIDPAREFVQRFVLDRFKSTQTRTKTVIDPKTRLNQWAQSQNLGTPVYQISESTGPDHDPTFKVTVTIGEVTCESDGVKSKQTGEQAAAAEAYRLVTQLPPADEDPDSSEFQLIWDE